MTTAGLQINKQDLNRIVRKLQSLPTGVRRNAATSALNAGARVIRDKARSKAPACLKRTIKNVRLKQENGDPVTAIAAGVGEMRPNEGFLGSFNKGSGTMFGKDKPCVAMWIEFGTYGRRDYKGTAPYAPSTLRKKSYATGRSNSPFWAVKPLWIAQTPFMRPALQEAATDGSVERAMVKKFDEYFKKIGV
jgi:hypothetical protein